MELVEGSRRAGGPDENLVIINLTCKTEVEPDVRSSSIPAHEVSFLVPLSLSECFVRCKG